MLAINLQRFAGERTERATPTRRREARKEGRVPQSRELTSAVVLIVVITALKMLGPRIWNEWFTMMQTDLVHMSTSPLTPVALQSLFLKQVQWAVLLVSPILGIGLGFGIFGALIQVGPMFLPKLLTPDFGRVNPLAGFKRIWSLKSGVEAVKNILKLTVVGLFGYQMLRGITGELRSLVGVGVAQIPGVIGAMAFRLAIEIAVLFLALAALDYGFQRFDFERSIRMSREEIKEEHKRQEGDPFVKSRIRQRGRQLSMRRMMQEIPKADVVITNPTHFAVAIRYSASEMGAPMVIGKGQDDVALRIKTVATDASVPLVENKLLARTLFKTVDVGSQIPEDLYQAVAEVLAYVYRMRRESQKG